MAPKKKTYEDEENSWRRTIEEAQLDEETWKVKVILIESAGSEQERIYLNKFEIYAAEEKRFVIKNICKTETIFMINQLGADQKVKDPNLRVFEECQSYLSDKKDIPSDFLALVIKYLILKMKDEYLYIRRQRFEVKQGTQRESSTMLNRAEVRGTVCVKVEEPPPPPPSVKGKGKGDGEPAIVPIQEEGKKFSTQLRVRGEEWRDKVYVDDYPTDGPNLYVAVTGFVEPYLAGSLVKIGIPLTAVVQIRIDPTMNTVPSTLFRATKRGQSLTELLAEKSMKFWEDIQQLRIHKSTADVFKGTAFIVFSPPYWKSDDLSGNSNIIYDELCFLMYDVQDLSRQHLHYLDNMSIIDISEDVSNDFINRHYQQIINDLPLECVTIYSILDSILQTACFRLDLDEMPSKTSLSSANTLNGPKPTAEENSANLVKQIFNTLCNTGSVKKKYRLTYGQEYEENKDPIVLDYGDFAKYNTFQLGDINLDKIVFSSLLGMPIHSLWQNQPRPSDELEAKINFHVNVLLSCFDRTDVETAELNRLINILACRKLYNNRSSLKKRHLPPTTIYEFKKKYLKRSVLAEPLARCPSLVASGHMSASFPSMTKSENEYEYAFTRSDPDPEVQRIKLLFDCPDIGDLVSAAEIENDQPMNHNMIDDFDFFEDLTGNCAFQIMRDAFNKFNCVDYKYCEVTDCFILMFYNSHDKEGIAREEWRSHLVTPLCLQDFFDFILEEQYDWIQNEENVYDENLLLASRSVSKDFIDPLALQSCIETTDVETELLMEGSLKYEEFIQLEGVPPESNTEFAESIPTKSPISFDLDSKTNKKARSGASQKTPKYKQSFHRTSEYESMEIPAKPFLGYDLGDRRVEVFGKDAIFFSRDGTKVTSLYTLTIPINLEYIVLNILPGNSYNEFWVHKALGDLVKPEVKDTCESFRITSKDRVLIYVRKQMYKVILEADSTGDVIHDKKNTSLEDAQLKREETKYFHSLYVSWPNGMITETVYENNSPVISHIKQYHTVQKPDLDEEMRCISLNGEVIIFKPSNVIEVLKPDGTWIKIDKYYKRVVSNPSLLQEPQIEPLDKGKKSRVKLQKTARKASVPEATAEKPLEYEVVVTEFEIIESSGLRQRWDGDEPFTIEKLLIKTATDYCLGEVFSRRMDGTNILMNKNGLHCVTFPDKTRIVTSYVVDDVEIYPEWTEEELEYLESFDPETIEGAGSKGSGASQRSYGSSATSESKKMEEEEVREKERTDGYVFIHILYTIEHPNFSTISINNVNGTISVESPNETTVIVDKNNNYDFILDNVTTANFDGETLNISYEACSECRAYTNCNVTIMKTNEENSSNDNVERVWLKMTDSFNTQVIVNDEGSINISDETLSEDMENGNKNPSEEKEPDVKSESSLVSHGKCREMYSAKNIRFFILRRYVTCLSIYQGSTNGMLGWFCHVERMSERRLTKGIYKADVSINDGTGRPRRTYTDFIGEVLQNGQVRNTRNRRNCMNRCTCTAEAKRVDLNCAELLHRALVEEYKRACRWQPWCSINQYDTFGDHRKLVSILTPIHITETEKWLMDSKQASKPKFMTYKDLKPDTGKGFYHWMRPYERFVPQPLKPDNVLPERLPRAYILRTLEREWDEEKRKELKGARELLTALLRYRYVMQTDCETLLNAPIIDLRSEDERRIDDIIQALAHRIYEDLKLRITDNIQSRAKLTITTKPPVKPEELSFEGESFEEEETDEAKQKVLEEERESLVKEAEAADASSPALRRYWRRRAEEYKEEQFYKYLLREGSVPPYYRNLLGGAIWWDVNNVVGQAVTRAERRKMKCVCADYEKFPAGPASPRT